MKKIILLNLLMISSTWAQDLQLILDDHFQRLKNIPTYELNFYEKLIAKSLRKYAGSRLNERTINYLATHEQFILSFKKASEFANSASQNYCQSEKGHFFFLMTNGFNNEVDALRHLLWSGKLVLLLGEKEAFNLTSLHEDRLDNPKRSMQMDLWNNYQGITYTVKENISQLPKSQQDKKLLEVMTKILNNGSVKVITNSNTQCQRTQWYPNF